MQYYYIKKLDSFLIKDINKLYILLELNILQYILQRIAILIATISYLKINTSNTKK